MKYLIKMASKHGMEVHQLLIYSNDGILLNSHDFMSRGGVENKLQEYRRKS